MKQRVSPGQLSFGFHECLFCGDLFVPRRRATQAYCSQLCQKRDKKFKPDVVAKIQLERAQGKSFKQIANELKLSVGSVHAYAKEILAPNLSNQGTEYILLSPCGEFVCVPPRQLASFCRSFNLRYDCIQSVLHGKQIIHRGWRLPSICTQRLSA